MMRTTLNLSDSLMKDLMEVTGSKTKTDAIEEAIQEFIRKRKIERLKSLSGKVALIDNWRELRALERDET